MITDIWTVMWKEFKEFLGQRGTLVSILVFFAIFGIFFPAQVGRSWLSSPVGLLNATFLPLFLVLGMVADSFAGERERHTLETLLASRLSDRAILFGKLIADIAYGWGLMLLGLLLALITVNLTTRGGFLFYPVQPLIATLVFGLLFATLMAEGGVLFSLRAATVRQAQQTLSIGMMAVIFVPIFATRAIPEDIRNRILHAARDAGLTTVGVLLAVAIIIVDAIVLAIVMTRFQRSKLILD